MYRIEDIEIDVGRACLRKQGKEMHLRRKSFQVLSYLVENRERLVSKDELFATLWPETAVTDDVLVQCIRDVRRAIGDDPHNPRFIKTVPRSGYRFIGTVEENGLRSDFTEEITRVEFEIEENIEEHPVGVASLPGRKAVNPAFAVAAAGVLLFAIGAFAYLGLPSSASKADVRLPSIPGRPSVAVLFFENASGDAELDWLREGLADMLITNLSRSDRLTVLSRQQLAVLVERSGRASGDIDNAFDIAGRSGAEAFVSGSFARFGERVRINVQVHDTASGSLRASESMTAEKLDDILSQIDILSLKLARHLNAEGTPAGDKGLATAMTDNIEAYRLYSLGVAKAKAFETSEAIELLKRSATLDPDFAMAHARIGYTYAITKAMPDEGRPYLEKAFKMSSRLTERDRTNIAAWYEIASRNYPAAIAAYREIIRLEPLDTEGYWRLARLLAGENRTDEAIDIARQGIAVDPEAKNLFNTLGGLYSSLGKHQEAIAAHQRYVALAPDEPNAYDSLGLTYQWAGDGDRAMESFDQAIARNPNFEVAVIHRAFCQIRRGEYRAAIETANRFLDLAKLPGERARAFDILSYIHLRLGELTAAETAAKTHLELAPNGLPWISYEIARQKGRTEQAKVIGRGGESINRLSERGSRINPRFLLYFKGTVALDNGRGEEALAHFREGLKHRPPTYFEDFEDALGRAYLTLGRFDEAIAEFERVLTLAPNYPRIRFYLARALRGKGMMEQARANYSLFLSDWKNADADLPEVIEAREF
jgi:tetratricopeptide (TPR) repeat protein/DNA-binding winged helix-turn-helix (wHTH) protein